MIPLAGAAVEYGLAILEFEPNTPITTMRVLTQPRGCCLSTTGVLYNHEGAAMPTTRVLYNHEGADMSTTGVLCQPLGCCDLL